MTVNKQFAQDDNALDDQMDSLLEVLAELLEEPQYPAAGADDQAGAVATAELLSGPNRAIHVVSKQEK